MIAGKPYSLSQRLLIGLGTASLVYWIAIAMITIRDNADDVNELYDVHLAYSALALLRITDPVESNPASIPLSMAVATIEKLFDHWPDLPERNAVVNADTQKPQAAKPIVHSATSNNVKYGKSLRYQVWRNDGSLMFRSENAPDTAMTEQLGFSDTRDAQGKGWRHYSVWDSHHDVRIVVSEAHELRNQLVSGIAINSAGLLALGLPVLVLLLWFSIKKGLDPLNALSREIAIRKPDNLTLLDESSAPREVRPIVTALNVLLQRMAQTLEDERRFTDNAAHELRTPLAAIQAQLYAVRSAEGKDERLRAMNQLQRSVERGIRLVSQMLTLARVDPEQTLPDIQFVNFEELAEFVCADLAPEALQRDQTLELMVRGQLPPLIGNTDLLSLLLRNLVDNAIHYAGRGCHITVTIGPGAAGLQLEVNDDGPGIPETQRERVFERFYRLADQEHPGTGLGLTICQRVAKLHQAKITLSDGPKHQGLTVCVDFPA